MVEYDNFPFSSFTPFSEKQIDFVYQFLWVEKWTEMNRKFMWLFEYIFSNKDFEIIKPKCWQCV